jgi:hypothetical protein
MISTYKVTIRSERKEYVRVVVGSLMFVMNSIDNKLESNRQSIGIPFNEKIIEVSYKKY